MNKGYESKRFKRLSNRDNRFKRSNKNSKEVQGIPPRRQEFFGVRQKTKCLLVGYVRETDSKQRTIIKHIKIIEQ